MCAALQGACTAAIRQLSNFHDLALMIAALP